MRKKMTGEEKKKSTAARQKNAEIIRAAWKKSGMKARDFAKSAGVRYPLLSQFLHRDGGFCGFGESAKLLAFAENILSAKNAAYGVDTLSPQGRKPCVAPVSQKKENTHD